MYFSNSGFPFAPAYRRQAGVKEWLQKLETQEMYKIAVIPGDGTGPEVIAEGLKVLKTVSEKFKFKYQLEHFDLGGERYLRTREILPDSVLEELKGMDAIYLGAIGHPEVKPGILEQGILLKIRFQL
jgi:3-isopropylmalate dehydrogenase